MTQDSKIIVRPYIAEDYLSIVALLENERVFDPVVDSAERLEEKIKRDPRSIFVSVQEDQIIGTASIMEDGRMAFILRWTGSSSDGLEHALRAAEEELASRGYNEASLFIKGGIAAGRERFIKDSALDLHEPLIQVHRELHPSTLSSRARR